MQIERFEMERTQCLYENIVELNLSESGVLPLRVEELVESQVERQRFLETQLWYCESDGSRALRERIAQFYPDCTAANVTITNGALFTPMHSFRGKLTDEQMLDVLSYIRNVAPFDAVS